MNEEKKQQPNLNQWITKNFTTVDQWWECAFSDIDNIWSCINQKEILVGYQENREEIWEILTNQTATFKGPSEILIDYLEMLKWRPKIESNEDVANLILRYAVHRLAIEEGRDLAQENQIEQSRIKIKSPETHNYQQQYVL